MKARLPWGIGVWAGGRCSRSASDGILQMEHQFKEEAACVRSYNFVMPSFCVQEKPCRWLCFSDQRRDCGKMAALNWKPFVYGGLASITAECGKEPKGMT